MGFLQNEHLTAQNNHGTGGYRHFCAESNGSCEQSQYWRGLETEQGINTYL